MSQATLFSQKALAVGMCLCTCEDGQYSFNLISCDRRLLCIYVMEELLVTFASLFECMQDRQTFFTAIDITRRGLTKLCYAGPNAKQVVPDLEGYADGMSKAAQAIDGILAACTEQRAHFRSATHQGSGFTTNHVYVHGNRDILTTFKTDIEILTF